MLKKDPTVKAFGLSNIEAAPMNVSAILLPPAKLQFGTSQAEPGLSGIQAPNIQICLNICWSTLSLCFYDRNLELRREKVRKSSTQCSEWNSFIRSFGCFRRQVRATCIHFFRFIFNYIPFYFRRSRLDCHMDMPTRKWMILFED